MAEQERLDTVAGLNRKGKVGGARYAWVPTPAEIEVLLDASKTLQQAADEVGRGVTTVWAQRRKLGIETSRRRQWTPEEEALLYNRSLTSTEVAARVGCSEHTVQRHRRALGTGKYLPEWPAAETALLLDVTKTAGEVAAAVGKSRGAVDRRRRALGVVFTGIRKNGRSFAPSRDWTPAEDAVLLDSPRVTAEIAEKLGRTHHAAQVRKQRLLGEKAWTPDEDAVVVDPRLTLQEAARRTGRERNAVVRRRKLLGFVS